MTLDLHEASSICWAEDREEKTKKMESDIKSAQEQAKEALAKVIQVETAKKDWVYWVKGTSLRMDGVLSEGRMTTPNRW